MYQSRITKQQREERLQKLLGVKSQLERGVYPSNTLADGVDTKTMITNWKTFVNLPDAKRAERLQAWDAYYSAVQTGTMAKLFAAQKEAYDSQNFTRFYALAKEAKAMREAGYQEFEKPAFPDPYEMQNSPIVVAYLKILQEINELSRVVTAPVVDNEALNAFSSDA
jgi:hypothetical protein